MAKLKYKKRVNFMTQISNKSILKKNLNSKRKPNEDKNLK